VDQAAADWTGRTTGARPRAAAAAGGSASEPCGRCPPVVLDVPQYGSGSTGLAHDRGGRVQERHRVVPRRGWYSGEQTRCTPSVPGRCRTPSSRRMVRRTRSSGATGGRSAARLSGVPSCRSVAHRAAGRRFSGGVPGRRREVSYGRHPSGRPTARRRGRSGGEAARRTRPIRGCGRCRRPLRPPGHRCSRRCRRSPTGSDAVTGTRYRPIWAVASAARRTGRRCPDGATALPPAGPVPVARARSGWPAPPARRN